MEELSANAPADAGDLEEGAVRVARHSRFSNPRVLGADDNYGMVSNKVWPS